MLDQERAARLDRALTGMFRELAARPLPAHVLQTVELLEASPPAAPKRAA